MARRNFSGGKRHDIELQSYFKGFDFAVERLGTEHLLFLGRERKGDSEVVYVSAEE